MAGLKMYLKNSHVWHTQASTGPIMAGTLCFTVEREKAREREHDGDGMMKNQLNIYKKGGKEITQTIAGEDPLVQYGEKKRVLIYMKMSLGSRKDDCVKTWDRNKSASIQLSETENVLSL